MANEEQLARLKASIADNNRCETWNQWRNGTMTQSYVGPIDLSDADLSGAVLVGADLSDANLRGIRLRGADLRGANFTRATLRDALLTRADLSLAKLEEANLVNANLSPANLTNANLSRANLSGANLQGTILKDAFLNESNFFDRDNGGICLYEAQLEQTNLSTIEWEYIPRLGDELAGSQRRWFLRLLFLGWKENARYHRSAARAYQRLVKNLRDQNLNDEADKFAYRSKICQRRMHFRKILKRPSHFGQYLFSHILNLVAGYGYKPERTLFWYLATVFGFMFLYLQISQGWTPFGLTTPTSLQPHLQWYEALILSVSSFHGRGFFQPINSLGDPVAAIAPIEAVVGLFIEVSFIATFTQRFFGK